MRIFKQKIAALRESDCVDYSSILALKLTALESLFDFFQRSQSAEIVTRRTIFADLFKNKGEPFVVAGLI